MARDIKKFNVPEVGKSLDLTIEYPKDEDPSKIVVTLPYKQGKVAYQEWVTEQLANIGGGGGGGTTTPGVTLDQLTYSNAEQVPTTLGGVVAGTTFNKMSLQDVITMLLYPYQTPSITTFTTPTSTFEIGNTTGNSLQLTWTTKNEKNIKPNSIKFYLGGTQLAGDNFPTSGTHTFTITPTVLNNQGTVNILMEMYDTKNTRITKNITLTWLNNIYYGVQAGDTISEAELTQLTKLAANSIGRKYDFAAGGYKYIAYPAAWGEKASTSFINPANNFVVPMDKQPNVSVTNQFGVTQQYLVYRSTNLLNGSISITVK